MSAPTPADGPADAQPSATTDDAKEAAAPAPAPAAKDKIALEQLKRQVSVAKDENEAARESVVKIFTNKTKPNAMQPWISHDPTSSRSSGFVIKGKRIMCNAHGVVFASSVKVRKHGSPKKHIAKVLIVSHECDLALLTVEDDSFWEKTTPLEFTETNDGLPKLQSEVVCLGYPIGGDSISITVGVVSRISMHEIVHAGANLPMIQTDAAINPGNSGGPSMQKGKVIGVNAQGLTRAQNIGYFIPCPVIKHFLDDIEKNNIVTGFGRIEFFWEDVENPSLRKYLKFEGKGGDGEDKSGILVAKVPKLSTAYQKLEQDDVIMSVNGHKIGDDGTIELPRTIKTQTNQRVDFDWVTSMCYPGDVVKFGVYRAEEEKEIEIEVQKLDNHALIWPLHSHDIKPTYYVWAGFVFTHYTRPLTRAARSRIARTARLLNAAQHTDPEDPEERMVVIPTVLDHPINISYETSHKWSMVEKINGVKVKNCKSVMEIIESAETPFIRIDCVGKGPMLIEREFAEKANGEIMRTHSVYSLKSEDLGGKFPTLGGSKDDEKEEDNGFEANVATFEALAKSGMKILDKMGIPKNGPSAKAALAAVGAGDETDLLSWLTDARGFLDAYQKGKKDKPKKAKKSKTSKKVA